MSTKYHWQCDSGENYEFLFVSFALVIPFLALLIMLFTLIIQAP